MHPSLPRLKVEKIVSRPFDENTYIANLEGQSDCIVLDPGLEPEKIMAALNRAALTPSAILNTHGHADHIGGNGSLKARWPECLLMIGQGDAAMLTDARLNLSAGFGAAVTSPPADRELFEGETVSAAGIELSVLEIPGHSPGHIVFVFRGAADDSKGQSCVFGGDVLFAGSVGRTDLPGGSFSQLRRGIQEKLFVLPDDTIVLPGHGEATTIGEEREHNPFVGRNARERA